MTTGDSCQQSTNGYGVAEKVLIDFASVQPDKEREWAHHFVNLLKSYKGLELQYRIMLKAMECIGSYSFKLEPSMPRIWYEKMVLDKRSLDKMSKEDRADAMKRINAFPEVIEYKKQMAEWQSGNLSNALFLEDMINVFTESKDEVNLPRVIKIYNKYPQQMGNWKKKLYAEKETSVNQDSAPQSVGVDAAEDIDESGWPV